MSSVIIAGDTSGLVEIKAPLVAGTSVINLPNRSGTFVVTDGKVSGTVQSFSCERSGVGTVGNVMAFGNGVGTGKGLRMPFSGKLILATLSGIAIDGTVTVQAYLNGVANSSYQLTGTAAVAGADIGQTQDWSASPLSFSAGSTLGWYQAVIPTSANGYVVSFYVMFD